MGLPERTYDDTMVFTMFIDVTGFRFVQKTRLYIIEILFTIANLAERHWFDSLKFVIFMFNYNFPLGTVINLSWL